MKRTNKRKLRRFLPIVVDGKECIKIELSQGLWALVDAADAPLVHGHLWWAVKNGNPEKLIWYAHRRVQKHESQFGATTEVQLHRVLFGGKRGIDHRNSDGLDNRRCNLRFATRSQQQGNTRIGRRSASGLKGVSYIKPRGNGKECWSAHIKSNRKARHLGYFATPIEAAHAYNAAALKQWGEFARLNPIP